MADIDEISQMLGRFEEALDALKKGSALGQVQRSEMILRLANIEGVSGRVTELERRQGSVERAVNVHEKWRQQGIGVSKFIAVISGLIGAAVIVAVQYALGIHK